MIQLLSLIEALATHVTPANIDQFVSLVEGLVKLAENVKSSSPSNATPAPTP